MTNNCGFSFTCDCYLPDTGSVGRAEEQELPAGVLVVVLVVAVVAVPLPPPLVPSAAEGALGSVQGAGGSGLDLQKI